MWWTIIGAAIIAVALVGIGRALCHKAARDQLQAINGDMQTLAEECGVEWVEE